jgi:hypothetical protein
MNLTQEGDKIYFASRPKGNKDRYIVGIDPISSTANSFKYIPSEKELLEDKFRTTPNRGLVKISKSFTINWKKLTNFFGFRSTFSIFV